jgi:uncharacterized membrane protein
MGVVMHPEPPPGRKDQSYPRPASADESRRDFTDMFEAALHVQLRDHLRRVEELVVGVGRRANFRKELENVIPAWMRPTRGEPRWPVTVAVLLAIGLQLLIPESLALRPRWVLPALEFILLILLVAANPRRVERDRRWVRMAGLSLVAIASLANIVSVARLVIGLVQGTLGQSAGPLLVYGALIWSTNVIIFGLWYWKFDRGGPVERAKAAKTYPDFQFPQMLAPELTDKDWEPQFVDYLYVSFTNATAFSPTDTMPLSRWAKMLMLVQSGVSLITVALVVARAVNILK